MTTSPLVSWLIPAHILNDLLMESINSCLCQTFDDHEVIIVANGPQKDLIKSTIDNIYADQIKVKTLVSVLPGIAPALNLGLQHASGIYVARMDSDDFSRANRLLDQLALLYSSEYNIVCSNCFSPANSAKHSMRPDLLSSFIPLDLQLFFRNPIIHPTVVAKRSDLNEAGGYPSYPYSEDYGLWIKLKCLNKLRVYKLASELVCYNSKSSSGARGNPRAYLGQALATLDSFSITFNPIWLISFLFFLSKFILFSFYCLFPLRP